MRPVLISAIMPGSKWDIRDSEMKTLTDDPDWARDIFEARVLAMMFVRKYGCALQGSPCLQSVRQRLDGHILSESITLAAHYRCAARRSRFKS
jgi:hypothetical protein